MIDQDQQPTPATKPLGKKNKRPKWLKALEAQSWQAELLISGVIIAGLLQAPEVVTRLVEGYILNSTGMGFTYLSMASFLLLAVMDCLILFFAVHFIMRTIWVALLGLNSVYPKGIDVTSEAGAGPKYWEKAKTQFPDLSAYNLELDRYCSVIFALATATSIIVVSISLFVVLFYLLFSVLVGIFPGLKAYVVYIGIGAYVLFTSSSFILQYVVKKYPDSKRAERWITGYGNVMSGFMSLYFFKKPVGYIINIYTSNMKSKYAFWMMVIGGFFLGMSGASQTDDHPVFRYFSEDHYFTFNDRESIVQDFNYESMMDDKLPLIAPVIQSDVVYRNEPLRLFIPTIEREKEAMNLIDLGILERIKMSRPARDSVSVLNLKRYQDFNQIFLDGQPVLNTPNYFYHPQSENKGLLYYLPLGSVASGKHLLEIRKNYFSEDGVQKVVKIPFFVQ